jgi:FlaA1/EpsC-like NDP-sugar epimerase
LIITAQMIVVYILVFFVSPRDALPRLFILYYGVASFILISLWRFARPALLGWASKPRRTLVVGTGWATEVMIDAIHEFASDEYEVHGIIGKPEEVGQVINGVPVLGAGADMMNFVPRSDYGDHHHGHASVEWGSSGGDGRLRAGGVLFL